MKLVTTGDEDREARKLLDEALEKAFDAGLIDKPEDVPLAELLWKKLMQIINVEV